MKCRLIVIEHRSLDMNVKKKYWDAVYVYVLLFVPLLCSCAGTYWTIAKLVGEYRDVEWYKIAIFDGSQIVYLLLAILVIYKNKKDPTYLIKRIELIKVIATTVLLIQYILIMSFFTSAYVWECTILFLFAIALFFDTTYMFIHSVIYAVVLFIGHIINMDEFLPTNMENVGEALAFRIVLYILITVCIIIIVYFVEHFLIRIWENEEENSILLEKQLKYYKDLELLDLELRKFKHDVKNHFISMESLLENEKINELKDYFDELQGQFTTRNRILFSGNDVVDAIMHYELLHNCNKNVNISVYGKLPEISTVSPIDLCTVFSNLLSNAINAVNKCEETKKTWLEISFSSGKTYFSIEITNNVKPDSQDKRKNDRNHGYGISKIQDVIKKYTGNYEFKKLDDKVKVIVYLPI